MGISTCGVNPRSSAFAYLRNPAADCRSVIGELDSVKQASARASSALSGFKRSVRTVQRLMAPNTPLADDKLRRNNFESQFACAIKQDHRLLGVIG